VIAELCVPVAGISCAGEHCTVESNIYSEGTADSCHGEIFRLSSVWMGLRWPRFLCRMIMFSLMHVLVVNAR